MAGAYSPAKKGSRPSPSHFDDDDGFNTEFDPDMIRLLEENARLRALVAQLSTLVLKHVVSPK